jgi:two-component system CitB family sensor kinase
MIEATTKVRGAGQRGGNRRLSTLLLRSQLAVVVVTLLAGFGMFVQATRHELDEQFQRRALAIAQATANVPQVQQEMAAGDPDHQVAALAEQLRASTGAAYIVVVDRAGIRHSHPNPELIGRPIDSPLVGLSGVSETRINETGSLGRSANGVTPLRAPDGTIIGEVSAGILETRVSQEVVHQLPTLLLYAGLALLLGIAASLVLARRLKRRTFGLELHELATLLQEREAMLHGIREGVVTTDPAGRISLVNDEAQRLLELMPSAIGRPLDDILPPGRLRDLLAGRAPAEDDGTVLTDHRCLTVTRMAVTHGGRPLGAVATLRDRTELVELMRELDGVRNFAEALRAQQHEHANRMHSLVGLLELGREQEASEYLAEISSAGPALAERLLERLGNPAVVALLLAKVTIAGERAVTLSVEVDDGLDVALRELSVGEGPLVTVVGNLVDNALDAVAGRPGGRIEVRFARDGDGVELAVQDNGPGIDPAAGDVFADGVSTKPARQGVHRGLGLALVRRLVVAAGGRISVSDDPGAHFRVWLPLAAGGGNGAGGAARLGTASRLVAASGERVRP